MVPTFSMNPCNSRLVPGPALLALALFTLTPPSHAADPMDDVNQLVRQWVMLRVETAQLNSAWRSERELVQFTLAALQEKAATAEGKRDLLKAKTAKDREDLEALSRKRQGAAEDLKISETRLQELAKKLVTLRPELPTRLSEALEMTYRSLAMPDRPFGERMQLAMNVLNRCNQFNHLVTTGEDVLTIEGEANAKSLKTIYWGLSHGYAVDRAAHRAWLGAPRGGKWQWEARPEEYENIMRLIAIATDRADPDFVTVPAPASRLVTSTPAH